MNFSQMLRILKAAPAPTPSQLAQAARLLRSAGYRVAAPTPGTTGPAAWNQGRLPPGRQVRPTTPATRPAALPGWADRPQAPRRDTAQDDLLQGTMYDVVSSNVHSIGMRIDNYGDTQGTLMVRYLAQGPHSTRSGPGSLYAYYNVPVNTFRHFQRAPSPGGFVWDELRVRGTIAGHRYRYELIGVAGAFVASLGGHVPSYVPRQAKRGIDATRFVTRNFELGGLTSGQGRGTPGPGGSHTFGTARVQSQLAPSIASMRGPTPTRGPGAVR